MTIDEVSKRYHIPVKILKEYESWGLCGEIKKVMDDWQYDDTDLNRLSLIMTLHDIGLTRDEIEMYMRLQLEKKDIENDRLKILEKIRNKTLDEIHFREKQLERLDYLRYEIKNMKN